MKTPCKATFCLLLTASSVLFAQEFRATISGQVTDQSGAAVVGAKVTAVSVERNVPYEAVTNSSGRYLIQFLLPGNYTLTSEQSGFKKYVREGISLLASDKAVLDIKLELGTVSDSVTVSGQLSDLQTESATRQSTVENRILEDVPAGGRNLYALEYNEPGVVKASTYWGSMELYAFGNVNGVQISGGKQGENETILDGVTNTKSDRGVAFVPNIAATQEFTIQTNSYDAQFGRVGGGVMKVNIKTGTNDYHGQLYDYFKNDKLNAGDWNNNAYGQTSQPFRNNTFGFEVDGPIRIPKVYDGRDKLFFLLSLEGLREHNPGGQQTTVPLPEQLKGDFSHLYNDSGDLVTIYDPLTTALGPDGKTYQRTPFPNNVIPATRINPVGSAAASYYPAPNFAGTGPANTNNYEKILPSVNEYDSWLGKLDYNFSDKSRVSFHYGQTPWLNYSKLVWGTNAAEPTGEYPSTRVARSWAADWTYILSPTMVFDLRAGLGRYEGFSGNTYGMNFNPAKLGFPSSLVNQFAVLEFPRFNVQGYSQLGSNGVYNYGTQDVYSLQPSLVWTHGRHVVHYGGEFRRYNDNQLYAGLASGQYNFDKSWTQANPLQGDDTSGNAIASMLLGYPTGGNVDLNVNPAFRSHYYALFAQDDFKLSSRLTLNLGLRWDYETPRKERYDRMVRGFAFDQASPIADAVKNSAAAAACPACAAGLMGGLLYAGTSGSDRYAFIPHKANFQPRIGVAYSPSHKLVFRGGWALSYLGQNSNGPQTGYSQSTPLVSTLNGGLTPAVSLNDPFPASIYPNGLLQPIGNTKGLATNLGQAISFQYLNRPLPYSMQYSGGFQYALPVPGNWLVDVSYVGNQTRRLPVSLGLNFIPTNVLNSLPVDQRVNYFTQQVANPMVGLIPNSGLNGPTIPLQQLLVAYPQYTNVTQTDVPIGTQRYDSVQMKLSHRFSYGLSLTISYTNSKNLQRLSTLNPQDVNLANLLDTPLEKRLVSYDVPQQTSIMWTYDFPFGKGRHFGTHVNKWVDGVLGGWTVAGAFNSHSGFVIPFPNAAPLVAKSAAYTDAQRDAIGKANGTPQWDITNDVYFNTSIFPTQAQAPYTLQNFPTVFPDVRTKPLNIVDLSLYKQFRITERVRFQLHCDAHNLGNFPWMSQTWGGRPDSTSDVTSSQFGTLQNEMGNEVRMFVMVAKIVF
jgi:hypothetical protein